MMVLGLNRYKSVKGALANRYDIVTAANATKD